MLTASVYIDISSEPDDLSDARDRRRLDVLEGIPDGARVTVYVGARQHPSPDAVRWLHAHSERLHIELTGATGPIARAWLDSARTGDPVSAPWPVGGWVE